MNTPSKKYWEERALQREKNIQSKAKRAIARVSIAYDNAVKNIENELKTIFNKFALDGKLSADDARQLLNNVETQEVINELKAEINSVEDDALKRELLNRINAPAYAARLTKLEALKERAYIELKKTAGEEISIDKSSFIDTYSESYYRSLFDVQQGIGYAFEFAVLPNKAIETVINSRFKGKNFSQRVWGNTEVLAQKAQAIVESGILSGSSIQKMANDLQDLSLAGKSAATRLIRTETNYFMNQGELESYKECDFEKYEYVATLDLRTSAICAGLDGKQVLVKDAVAGVNYPPMHPWCRSTTIAVFDNDVAKNLKTRVARGIDGKNYKVPADMKYEEWKKSIDEKHGEGTIDREKKKVVNLSSDKIQHKKYKAIFGKEFPNTIEEFKNMKYNSTREWDKFKNSKQERLNQMDFKGMRSLVEKLGDGEVRAWYDAHDRGIPNLIDRSKSIEEQARQAHELRNTYRTQARDLMKNQEARKKLDAERPNETFEQTISRKMTDKGLTREQAIEDTLKTASTPNNEVNKKYGLED